MTIQTPLHAEHQLDQLAGQFAHWRQTRTHPHSPIPPELWAHAVALTAVVPPSRVAKQLRLRLADLKKQMAARHAAPPAGPPLAVGFVEVPPVLSGSLAWRFRRPAPNARSYRRPYQAQSRRSRSPLLENPRLR